MIIHKADSIKRLLSEIGNQDKYVLYDFRLLKSYLSDMYVGRNLYLNIFLTCLYCLPTETNKLLSLTEKEFNCICFPNVSAEEQDVQEIAKLLLFNIYVKKNYLLQDVKIERKKTNQRVRPYGNQILSFEVNRMTVVQGDEIQFKWKVVRPFYLTLSDGEISMDISKIESIAITAVKHAYSLLLFDKNHKVIDVKTIRLNLLSPVYCINCGSRFFDESDVYCCNCGVKRL